MTTFDFKRYLSIIDPANIYRVTILLGGRVNLTVRAVKTQPHKADAGRFPGHESIVLKYALPYIAEDGEGAPFSQFRQTVEARALGLFARPNGELISLCDKWDIKIPQLLYHDSDSHIIIMADLGDLDSLTEQLKRMTPLRDSVCEEQQAYRELGARLGGFMAELHSPGTLEKLGPKCRDYFDNPTISSVIYDNMVIPIRRRLADFGVPDAEALYERIAQDHLRPLECWEQNFMLGDLWTGSVLIDWPRLCVIDWEFARIGPSVNGDMATLFAQLHLHLLKAQNGSPAEAALRTLIQSTAKEYRRQLCKPTGVSPRMQRFNLRTSATDFPPGLISAIRSAFITHGRKMINNAVERDWRCDCCRGKPGMKTHCKLIREMVERGVWYVRTAANNRKEFAEDTNWKEVQKEEGKIILGLFMEC